MSKISKYLEELRREEAARSRSNQTVSEFAKELNKSSDVLLDQLRGAGVEKSSDADLITDKDKESLLEYLQRAHLSAPRRRKVMIETESYRLLKAVAEQANGAEWECLRHFTEHLIADAKIDRDLQQVVNLIVAKSFILQALPLMKRGRPKDEKLEELGESVSQAYWDMRDSGVSYKEAVGYLAEKIHKDERHVMRLVEQHSESVGSNKEVREQRRRWAKVMRDMYAKSGEHAFGLYRDLVASSFPPAPGFDANDYIEHLDEQILLKARAKRPLTKMI